MWFGKAVEDFNTSISEGGNGGSQLVAATSNGFISELRQLLSLLCLSADHCYSDLRRICVLWCSVSVCSLSSPRRGRRGQGCCLNRSGALMLHLCHMDLILAGMDSYAGIGQHELTVEPLIDT